MRNYLRQAITLIQDHPAELVAGIFNGYCSTTL